MPVVFNEPLSFLQRMTEYMEYAKLLRIASEQEDPLERMKYIAGKWKPLTFNHHSVESTYSLPLDCYHMLRRPTLTPKYPSSHTSLSFNHHCSFIEVYLFCFSTSRVYRIRRIRIGIQLGTLGQAIQSAVGRDIWVSEYGIQDSMWTGNRCLFINLLARRVWGWSQDSISCFRWRVTMWFDVAHFELDLMFFCCLRK